ncbi:ATP-binding protein [Paremcibacter congregatus]|uniref:HAMP domain-containing sensor histidine kinase n=1 Tax=Paremcibacter congregatus TaxID=2043170 RepID=UPI003A8D5C8C
MRPARNFRIKTILVSALLLVTFISSTAAIVVFKTMVTDISQRVLPEERLLGDLQRLTLQMMQKYKVILLNPGQYEKSEFDALISEMENLKTDFIKNQSVHQENIQYISKIDYLHQELILLSQKAISDRQNKIALMKKIPQLQQKINLLETTPALSLATTYLSHVLAYAAAPASDTATGLAIEQQEKLSRYEPEEQIDGGLVARIVTTGKAAVSATKTLNSTIKSMEQRERQLLDIFVHEMGKVTFETNAALQKNFYVLLIILGAIAFITAIIAYLFSEYLIQPLRGLSHAAEKLGEGNLNVRVPVNRTDEIADMAIAFNRMASRLQQNMAEQKSAEKALYLLNKEMSRKSEALTLIAEDLRKTRDQARAADRAKSEFLAAMSHELRTPLNAIIGFSEMIMNEQFGAMENKKYLEYSKDINDSGLNLLTLINDILDLSKVEYGTEEMQEDYVDVDELCHGILRVIRQRAIESRIALKCSVEAKLPLLRCDNRKMKQVLMNLLRNAIKFTPMQGDVSLNCFSGEHGEVMFQIIDTGIGISPKDLPKAMSHFGQVDSGLNRRHLGTGLGLPLAKSLVELHGGTLNVHSIVNKGTTVTVTLPANRCSFSDLHHRKKA